MTAHKATPEQWEQVQEYGFFALSSCILELRSCVEALELWRATTGDTAPVTRDRAEDAAAPSNSLRERVADAIYINAMGGYCEQTRAAIHAIADWSEQQGLHSIAKLLRQEVGR